MVSVVIPTLGGKTLVPVLESLNAGTVVPDEIIIAIPKEYADSVENILYHNVRVLCTDVKGQVLQRISGFNEAKFEYVLQLDDDVMLDEKCLERLISDISRMPDGSAIAPDIINHNGEAYRGGGSSMGSVIKRIYYWLLNGRKGYCPGTIYESCTGERISMNANSSLEVNEVEWLAGGCVLHKKDNLLLVNYYPFSGKAYCEDIYHSYFLKRSGVRLYVDLSVRCCTGAESYVSQSIGHFLRYLYCDYRARRFFMKISSRKSLRIYLYYIVVVVNYFIGSIRRYISYGAGGQ